MVCGRVWVCVGMYGGKINIFGSMNYFVCGGVWEYLEICGECVEVCGLCGCVWEYINGSFWIF